LCSPSFGEDHDDGHTFQAPRKASAACLRFNPDLQYLRYWADIPCSYRMGRP
jgi:hypothetical protein